MEDSKGEDNERSLSVSSFPSKAALELSDNDCCEHDRKSSKLPSIGVFFSGDEAESTRFLGGKRLGECSQTAVKKVKEEDCVANPAEVLRQLLFKRAQNDV